MKPVDIIDELRGVVGDRHVQVDPDVLAPRGIDWLQRRAIPPVALVSPADADEVAGLLAACNEHRVGVVTQGGRTSLVAGSVPHGASQIALSTARLRTIDDRHRDAGSVTVGAGVTLAELDGALADSGWRYPIDFGARDAATIGGTVATNAGGIGAFRHGMTKQRVLGLDAVFANGTRLRHAGAPLKDNTGYSLDSLLCGSEGTLAVVTAATVSLAPRPLVRATAMVGCDSVASAIDLARTLRAADDGLEAVEYLGGECLVATTAAHGGAVGIDAPHILLVDVGDRADALDRLAVLLSRCCPDAPTAVAASAADRAALWAHRDRIGESLVGRPPLMKFDVALPGDGFAAMVQEAPRLARTGVAWCFGHACDQNLHLNVTGFDLADAAAIEAGIYERVLELGGSIAAEHGIGRTKIDWLASARAGGDRAAMRAIKGALDPNGILNPGVLFEVGGA